MDKRRKFQQKRQSQSGFEISVLGYYHSSTKMIAGQKVSSVVTRPISGPQRHSKTQQKHSLDLENLIYENEE